MFIFLWRARFTKLFIQGITLHVTAIGFNIIQDHTFLELELTGLNLQDAFKKCWKIITTGQLWMR